MSDERVRLWDGVAVALVTLFAADGSVDVAGTSAHAARLVSAGVSAVLVAGSTGEADALSDGERVALVAGVREACPDVPVIAGAGGAWAGPAAELTAASVAVGADAVLVAPPRRAGDLRSFYARVGAAADGRPVLAYHFPAVAGGAVPVEVLGSLPVAGVKDSTGDAERLLRLLTELSGWGGSVFVGSSALVLTAGALGAAGAILAVANVAPEDCLAAWAGDAGAQLRLTGPHVAAKSGFPHGLKRLMAERFGTSVAARMG